MTKSVCVVLASGNAGKAREFARLLEPRLAVRPLPGWIALPVETGETFAANARLKAEAVAAALGGRSAVLADDSGLEVTALGGRPGVMSARFAGEGAGDDANVGRLLAELGAGADRAARFVCSLCLVMPAAWVEEGADRVVEAAGVLKGEVTTTPRGSAGFGYDPVFRPEGWSLTLAEASSREKDQVSHRGAAARALLESLATLGIIGRQTGVGNGA